MTRSPILDDPIWRELRHWVSTDIGQQGNARIALKKDIPTGLHNRALGLWLPCVNCGLPIHPVRRGAGWYTQIFVTGCRDDGHKRCSYGRKAREAILSLIIATTGGDISLITETNIH